MRAVRARGAIEDHADNFKAAMVHLLRF